MSSTKEFLKKMIPVPLWNTARDNYISLKHLTQWPNAQFHPWRRKSIRHLMEMKDIHKGERCVVIGNGPSLQKTDISRIKDEYTFGMNRIYLAFPDWGFQTSYLACVNSLVIEQVADDLLAQPMPKFFSWRSREWIHEPIENTIFLHSTYDGIKFSEDVRGRIWEGATVTYVCLQLAFHMGFDEVILIGVDHTFAAKGKANETVVSGGDDLSHFDPRYFGKGFRWQLPDLDMSEQSYLLAKYHYEKAGRKIYDATIGGQLTVFPKVDYSEVFK
ncbi:MAG: DUF115 domain-containing protein [Anaerolineales bacterium]|nr:DUF115 domain-containing protein [Anaerolineales bacterium]